MRWRLNDRGRLCRAKCGDERIGCTWVYSSRRSHPRRVVWRRDSRAAPLPAGAPETPADVGQLGREGREIDRHPSPTALAVDIHLIAMAAQRAEGREDDWSVRGHGELRHQPPGGGACVGIGHAPDCKSVSPPAACYHLHRQRQRGFFGGTGGGAGCGSLGRSLGSNSHASGSGFLTPPGTQTQMQIIRQTRKSTRPMRRRKNPVPCAALGGMRAKNFALGHCGLVLQTAFALCSASRNAALKTAPNCAAFGGQGTIRRTASPLVGNKTPQGNPATPPSARRPRRRCDTGIAASPEMRLNDDTGTLCP
jgi:hypothetical protein